MKGFEIGNEVYVRLPSGWFFGEIRRIIPWFHNEIRFEATGSQPKPFITVVPAEGLHRNAN